MVSREKTGLDSMKLLPMFLWLLLAVCPLAAQEEGLPERDKTEVLREQGNNWIMVGIAQLNRGFYSQAEKSFIEAQEYEQYLAQSEIRKLQENLDKARQGILERKAVLEYLAQARELLNLGKSVEARAQYEKVRNSPYLTEAEREQIAGELKIVDAAFDKRRMEITQLYNRSVEFYRAGDLENARDGFSEVVKSGIIIAPKGQTAEDYLIQIDNILTEQFKSPERPISVPKSGLQVEKSAAQTDSNRQNAVPEEDFWKQSQKKQLELKEVKEVVETTPQKQETDLC